MYIYIYIYIYIYGTLTHEHSLLKIPQLNLLNQREIPC